MTKYVPQKVPRQQYESWFETLHTKKCLLCQPEKQIIIEIFKRWIWVENISPYFDYHTMIVPKRHILHLSDITVIEWTEFKKIYDTILKRYHNAEFKHQDGSPVKKLLWFVRSRDYTFDHSGDVSRPEHLHIHISPDYKGFFDPILHPEAHKNENVDKILSGTKTKK